MSAHDTGCQGCAQAVGSTRLFVTVWVLLLV